MQSVVFTASFRPAGVVPSMVSVRRRGVRIVCSSLNPGKEGRPHRPARDLKITFGDYRGEMLGTIPSGYLAWLAKNDRESWHILAHEVLADDVYRDRIELEKFLDDSSEPRGADGRIDGVAFAAKKALLAQSFGWDLDDKEGWSKVDFSLLGTSFGARIPRKDPVPGDETMVETKRKMPGTKAKEEESVFPAGGASPPSFPGRESLLGRLRRSR